MLHDVGGYTGFGAAVEDMVNVTAAMTVDELRAADRTHRVISVDDAVVQVRAGIPLVLHPLVGGLPPDVAWRYLRTVADEVMPRVTP